MIELNKIYCENCLETMARLPDDFVDCVVTSPPYWGLRDYGVNGQLGLENTPEEYIAKMVEIFREVRRVLKPNGTLWLNLGDTYNSSPSNHNGIQDLKLTINPIKYYDVNVYKPQKRKLLKHPILKQKDLIGIPWRVALSLQADGWWLRQDIIWSKPNPMPESVQDRCTKAHEYIFLLTKSAKYFYDAEAIQEKGVYPAGTKAAKGSVTRHKMQYINGRPPEYKDYTGVRNKRDVWEIATQPFPEAHFATFPEKLVEPCLLAGTKKDDIVYDPFMGAGTTAVVALRGNRQFIGSEINPEYIKIAEKRLKPYLQAKLF